MKKRGFTLVEIMIVVGVIVLLASIAIPNMIRARLQANESLVQAALRSVATAEVTYRISNPTYANLTQLGAAVPAYVESILGCAEPPCLKHGYNFDTADLTGETFFAFAMPSNPNRSGIRSFCVTEDGVVRFQAAGGAITDRDACLALPATQ